MGLLSAIRDYFTLPEPRALTPSQAWARDLDWPNRTISGENVTQGNATALATVYACTSLIADMVSTLPVDTYIKWNGFPKPYRPRPPWLDMPVPNDPSVSRAQHFSQVALSLLFDGNAFVLAQPSVLDPQMLTVLDPQRVRISEEAGRPRYRIGTASNYREAGAEQVLHIPRTRRPGSLRGMSPIDEAAETLGVALAAQHHSGRFYANGTLMSTVIKVPGEMNEEDAIALRDAFQQRHSGDNVFKTGVLTGGAEAVTLGVTPEQAQFLETIKFHVLEVCRLYRVPPMLVGVNEPGAVSYASSQEAVKAFHVNTLAPLLTIIQQGYHRLMPDDRVYLQFDTKGLLRADPEQRYQAYAVGLEKGFVSRNEVRGWEELPPIAGEGGDLFTVQAQMVSLEQVANPPEPPPSPGVGASANPLPEPRHLPGQHDQKTHAHGGGSAGIGRGDCRPGPGPDDIDLSDPTLQLFQKGYGMAAPAGMTWQPVVYPQEVRAALKDEVARDVGKRIEQEMGGPDAVLGTRLGAESAGAAEDWGHPEYTPGQATAAMIHDGWADTSGDHSGSAIALQESVREEFGLKGAADPRSVYKTDQYINPLIDSELASNGQLYRAYARAEYAATQDYLASKGITEVTVFRGMAVPASSAMGKATVPSQQGADDWYPTVTAKLRSNPLSSFSAEASTAEFFAIESAHGSDRVPVVMSTVIPASRIFSLPMTGAGCLAETEVIVLAGDGDEVTAWQPRM